MQFNLFKNNTERLQCPICNMLLEKDHNFSSMSQFSEMYQDYVCKSDDHFFAQRLRNNTNTLKIKVRLSDGDGSKLCIKINYDSQTTEVWKISNSSSNRVEVESVHDLDFSDINRIKNKIKAILLFS